MSRPHSLPIGAKASRRAIAILPNEKGFAIIRLCYFAVAGLELQLAANF
jgi:hypothetical protein